MFEIKIPASKDERRSCYRLRHIVFVEEQNVPVELEIDEHDETDAIHFLGAWSGEDAAAARMIITGDTAKIGRLVVLKPYRGKQLGHKMMQAMLDHAWQNPTVTQVVLDAQTYALPFYERLGFEPVGEEFMDAGIPHLRMRIVR